MIIVEAVIVFMIIMIFHQGSMHLLSYRHSRETAILIPLQILLEIDIDKFVVDFLF